MGEDKLSSNLSGGGDCLLSVLSYQLSVVSFSVLPSTIHKTLNDQRRAGKYRAAKMNSTTEMKDKVVARGLSHYSDGQLLDTSLVLSCCSGLCPLASVTTLITELSHTANTRVFVELLRER